MQKELQLKQQVDLQYSLSFFTLLLLRNFTSAIYILKIKSTIRHVLFIFRKFIMFLGINKLYWQSIPVNRHGKIGKNLYEKEACNILSPCRHDRKYPVNPMLNKCWALFIHVGPQAQGEKVYAHAHDVARTLLRSPRQWITELYYAEIFHVRYVRGVFTGGVLH